MSDPAEALEETLAGLHADATWAITSADAVGYRQITEAYAQMLLSVPEAWNRYRIRFETAFSRDQDSFGIGPLSAMARNIYEELRQAIHGVSREVAYESVALPYRVMQRAFAADAPGLVDSMQALLRQAYSIAGEEVDPHIAERTRESAWRFLMEFLDLVVESRLTGEDVDVPERLRAAEYLNSGFQHVAELLLASIEQSDLKTAQMVADRWARMFRYWHPERGFARRSQPERLIGRGLPGLADDGPDEARPSLDQIRDRLVNLRVALRFGLTMWALRRFEQEQNARSLGIVDLLGGGFARVEDLSLATQLALDLEYSDDRAPWSDWLLRELPEGEVHVINSDMLLVRTFAVLGSRLMHIAETASLRSRPWLLAKQGELESALTDISAHPPALLPHLPAGAERLRPLIREAAASEQASLDAQLRSAALDPAKMSDFRSAVIEGWRRNRLGSAIFAAYNKVEWNERATRGNQYLWRLLQPVPKEGLVGDSDVFGMRAIAEEIGASVARAEMVHLAARLKRVPRLANDDHLLKRVRRAVTEMASEGYEARLLLAPIEWNEEGLEYGRPVTGPLANEEAVTRSVSGHLNDVPVIQTTALPETVTALIDAEALGTWLTGPADDEGAEIHVAFTSFDPESSREFAEEHPNYYQGTLEERALEIQRHVLVEGAARFRCRIEKPEAGRRIAL